jgi:hypothetical protein
MAEKLLFYYFGDDEAYYRTLQGEFKKNTKLNFDFKKIYHKEESRIQGLFLEVYRNKADCVFIDFSKEPQDYLHLARILTRTPFDKKLITVGLVDYLSPPEVLNESIATGVQLTHIKSAETFDVVFDVTKLIAPNEIGEHGFATAALKEDWEAGIPVKIGYVHKEGLHFETDYRLQKGDRIRLNHAWTEKRTVPSKEMFIQNVSTSNLFYHFKYAVDAQFLFIDEFLPPEGMEEERVVEKRKERDELILYHQKQLSRWIDDNLSRSLEKKAKVLVVDREFHFYDHQTRTDKHPYTIRCVPFLTDIGQELDRLRPQVIAFALDKEGTEQAKNTNEELVRLILALKGKYQNQDFIPFVVVFNSKVNSKTMQENCAYTQLMATDQELSVDLLVRMADIFDKKLNEGLAKTTMTRKGEEKVFLRKSNAASIGEILIGVKILKLSETDLVLTSDYPLEPGMNLHFSAPIDMYVSLLPMKAQGKTPEFHGLIHCLGEVQKKELRKFVNSVFFRDHDAQVQAETDEFKKLNEAKLNEKVEAMKKEQEALAAAAAEAEAEKEETKTEETE